MAKPLTSLDLNLNLQCISSISLHFKAHARNKSMKRIFWCFGAENAKINRKVDHKIKVEFLHIPMRKWELGVSFLEPKSRDGTTSRHTTTHNPTRSSCCHWGSHTCYDSQLCCSIIWLSVLSCKFHTFLFLSLIAKPHTYHIFLQVQFFSNCSNFLTRRSWLDGKICFQGAFLWCCDGSPFSWKKTRYRSQIIFSLHVLFKSSFRSSFLFFSYSRGEEVDFYF